MKPEKSAMTEAKAMIGENFLLRTRWAQRLYHEHAAGLPIVDYHCHLDPRDLASDRRFEDIAQLWVTSDPYKHRAMRIAGVAERLITGDATRREKFDAWARTVPLTVGNPLHHWTALELARYFGVEEELNAGSTEAVWNVGNTRLREPAFSARGLLRARKVACVCTSERLLDDLSPHAAASVGGGALVLPSLRADDLVAVESAEFPAGLKALGEATGIDVTDFEAWRAAVRRRLDVFSAAGCRLSDHGLDDFHYVAPSEAEAARLFGERSRGVELTAEEGVRLRSALLVFLGVEYARRGWIMQLHLGAQRETSTRLRRLAGPAGGYAAIGAACDVGSLCRWFDELERAGGLPRVNLYPLDSGDFARLAVLTGSFAEDGVAGKLQLGPAWWFNDHGHGMRAQLDAIANHGLLATFIGMTTDSRSLLSMSRHEYFRRVLCDWVGEKVERGEFPADENGLGGLVRRLSWENARVALGLPEQNFRIAAPLQPKEQARS